MFVFILNMVVIVINDIYESLQTLNLKNTVVYCSAKNKYFHILIQNVIFTLI